MKISYALCALAFAAITMAFTPIAPGTNYNIDLDNSMLTWKGYKVTGSHTGTINLKSGTLEFDDAKLSGGFFEIDMTSLTCTDLSGDSQGKLEGHLKSDDFFGVEKFPTAMLRITSVASRGTPGDYKVTGNLTIKGKTKEIRFLANVDKTGGKATAEIEIDRSDFDVRYGSGSFFDNLGNKTIYDEFDLTVRLVMAES